MSRSVKEGENQYPLVWLIEHLPAFRTSLAAVPETPEVNSVLMRLIEQVASCPEEVERIPETNSHMVSIERVGTLPPLCLYYSCDTTTIYLLHVEEYDDLACDD